MADLGISTVNLTVTLNEVNYLLNILNTPLQAQAMQSSDLIKKIQEQGVPQVQALEAAAAADATAAQVAADATAAQVAADAQAAAAPAEAPAESAPVQ